MVEHSTVCPNPTVEKQAAHEYVLLTQFAGISICDGKGMKNSIKSATAHLQGMTTRLIAATGIVLSIIALPNIAKADSNQDAQTWTSLTATKSLSNKVDVTIEAHLRFEDDFSSVAQWLLRPSVTYKLPRRTTATIGYLYFRNDPETGQTTNEHRIWEQFAYSLAGSADLRLIGRTRLEQRFQQGSDGLVGWRARQQLRFEAPLSRHKKLKAIVWNETFLGFNNTSWGARSGFDQTRTFVGVGLPIGAKWIVEPGYLNQFLNRRGTDQINHVIALNFVVKF